LKALANKKKSEIYSQNFDISLMKKMPPKVNDLYLHNYSFSDKQMDKSNAFVKLNKEIIPIAFYNHLMVCEKNRKTFNNNKHKYFRASMTQRNKKKLLTVIYYSP